MEITKAILYNCVIKIQQNISGKDKKDSQKTLFQLNYINEFFIQKFCYI